jgi:hypothetical protein
MGGTFDLIVKDPETFIREGFATTSNDYSTPRLKIRAGLKIKAGKGNNGGTGKIGTAWIRRSL